MDMNLEVFWTIYFEGAIDLVFLISIMLTLFYFGLSRMHFKVDWRVITSLIMFCVFPIPFLTIKIDSAYARATTDTDSYQMVAYIFKFPFWWGIGFIGILLYILIMKNKRKKTVANN